MGGNVRSSAERLARAALKNDLKQRAALVGTAAETQARIEAILDDLVAAIDVHTTAIAAAERGGWNREQLRKLAIAADPAGAAGRAARRLRASAGERDSSVAEDQKAPVAEAADTPANAPAAAGTAPETAQQP